MNYSFIGFGHEVPVSAFLPDSATLAKLLNDEVKHSSAAIFVTASMDPQKVQLLDISLMCVHNIKIWFYHPFKIF